MRRTGSILRQQKDTCSCWACRDEKFREKRKSEKQKAIQSELNMYNRDDDIIFDHEMKATYTNKNEK